MRMETILDYYNVLFINFAGVTSDSLPDLCKVTSVYKPTFADHSYASSPSTSSHSSQQSPLRTLSNDRNASRVSSNRLSQTSSPTPVGNQVLASVQQPPRPYATDTSTDQTLSIAGPTDEANALDQLTDGSTPAVPSTNGTTVQCSTAAVSSSEEKEESQDVVLSSSQPPPPSSSSTKNVEVRSSSVACDDVIVVVEKLEGLSLDKNEEDIQDTDDKKQQPSTVSSTNNDETRVVANDVEKAVEESVSDPAQEKIRSQVQGRVPLHSTIDLLDSAFTKKRDRINNRNNQRFVMNRFGIRWRYLI